MHVENSKIRVMFTVASMLMSMNTPYNSIIVDSNQRNNRLCDFCHCIFVWK